MSPTTRSLMVLLSFLLWSLLITSVNANSVQAVNRCSSTVYCAIVKGCPQGQICAGASWRSIGPGQSISSSSNEWSDNTGMTIMCGRSNNPSKVSQVEWTSRNVDGKVHFDLSNVDGAVFANEGMTMYVDQPRTNSLPTCYGAVCSPGQIPCPYIYNVDYEDKRGMRACSQSVNVQWHMCFADKNLVLPPPGTGAV